MHDASRLNPTGIGRSRFSRVSSFCIRRLYQSLVRGSAQLLPPRSMAKCWLGDKAAELPLGSSRPLMWWEPVLSSLCDGDQGIWSWSRVHPE